MPRPRRTARPRIVITAGGTREPIDPVRYIGNRSSGKMGISLLRACLRRGYAPVLIHANLSVPLPPGRYGNVPVQTAAEMLRAVRKALSPGAVLAMAAAPADFRPARVSAHKIKKEACGKRITLTLERTADILATLRKSGPRPAYTVMFSAETRDLMRNSLKKMKAKDADLLVANDVGLKDSGFGSDDNRAVLVTRAGKVLTTGKISKDALADIIMDAVEAGLR